MRPLINIVVVLSLLYAGICAALFIFQRSLIYFPQPSSNPGQTLAMTVPSANLLVSLRPRPGGGAVLYFGGNAEDVSASMPQLAAVWPDRSLYAMHYRGYGGSSGSPSEEALQADARALFDEAVKTHPDITVVGRSLGSGIAIALAASRPVRRLVLVTPYDSIEDIAAGQFGWLPVRWLLRDRYRSIDLAPHIAVPTVLVQAEFDTIIPAPSTARLLAAFRPGVASLRTIRGAGHNDIGGAPGYLEAIREPGSPRP